MSVLRIYFDFIGGLFYFFTLEFFTLLNNPYYNDAKKSRFRIVYIIYTLFYAIPESIPHLQFLHIILTFLYILLNSNFKFKYSFFKFLKYELYIIASTITIFVIHSFIANDFYDINNSYLYYNYKSLICTSLSYTILCLFVYSKRFLALRSKKHHGVLFCVATGLSTFVLSGLSLALLSGRFELSTALPVIFSLIFVIIAIVLVSYSNMILSMEENTRQDVLISKYELEHDYYQNTQHYVDSFRALRHDFKNHLITLDIYAKQQDTDKLQAYIQQITDTLTDASIIQTPHELTSAILNAKALLCRKKNIVFEHRCYFAEMHISDFHLVTILGNVLDNAITAAAKIEDGHIQFSMEQCDSYLQINCKNTHAEKIIKKDGQFLSTKEYPNMFHGLGIKNIQNAVNELNGTLDISYDDSNFSVSILVPNYN